MGEGPGALKHQIIGTLHAATYMRGRITIMLPSFFQLFFYFPLCPLRD